MNQTTHKPLTERLVDPKFPNLDPHEVAKELSILHSSNNISGVIKLRDAYLVRLGRSYPDKSLDEIRDLVYGNLQDAAGLADMVSACGYEASGQLHVNPPTDGVIAQYVTNLIKQD
jgi:hypothetical protein